MLELRLKFHLGKFVPEGPIKNIPALVQIMAWRRSGDKPLSAPIMVRWVNSCLNCVHQCIKSRVSTVISYEPYGASNTGNSTVCWNTNSKELIWSRLSKIIPSWENMYYPYKGKTVSRPSYLRKEIPLHGNTVCTLKLWLDISHYLTA